MTLRNALRVLLLQSADHIRGAGCGLRKVPTDAEKLETIEAIERVWREVYGVEMTDSEKQNLRLPHASELT